MKAEALNMEVKLKGQVAKAKSEAKALKISLDAAKDDNKVQQKEFETKKIATAKKNKEAIEMQVKKDKLLVAASKAKLAKIQKEYLDAKNDLLAKIKKAKAESKLLNDELKVQKDKYKTLTADFKDLKVQLTKKYNDEIKKEKEIYKELEEDYKAQLKDCEEEYKALKADLKKIKADIAAKEKVIKSMKDVKVKRKKLADTITVAEKAVAAHAQKVTEAEMNRKSLCEMGTPGGSAVALCAKMLADSAKLKTEDAALQKKVDDLRKQLDAL